MIASASDILYSFTEMSAVFVFADRIAYVKLQTMYKFTIRQIRLERVEIEVNSTVKLLSCVVVPDAKFTTKSSSCNSIMPLSIL